MQYDVIVIGGGPAGMMAAGRAGELGAKVLLLEKNNRLGKKLSITGGGRCNVTNAEFNDRLFLEHFPKAKHFLFSPFSQFNAEDTFRFFESRGMPIKIEDRKRAFPVSNNADDVWNVMESYVKESGNVTVKLNTSVSEFVVEDGNVVGVKTSNGILRAKNFILAVGGTSAPETGSTGDGFRMLLELGHTIHKPNPGLVPLKVKETWVHELSGVALYDVQMRFLQDGKSKFKVRGDVLFTHFGISGPMMINASYRVKELLKQGSVIASIDLFPDMELNLVDKKLIDLFALHKQKSCKNTLQEFLKKGIVETIFSFQDCSFGDVKAHDITKVERKILAHLLKDLRMTVTGTMGYEYAIVADGGVEPKEIDFKTMRSRLFANVYCVGDLLNIQRPSGGYSLQLCWTSGFVAGTDVRREQI